METAADRAQVAENVENEQRRRENNEERIIRPLKVLLSELEVFIEKNPDTSDIQIIRAPHNRGGSDLLNTIRKMGEDSNNDFKIDFRQFQYSTFTEAIANIKAIINDLETPNNSID